MSFLISSFDVIVLFLLENLWQNALSILYEPRMVSTLPFHHLLNLFLRILSIVMIILWDLSVIWWPYYFAILGIKLLHFILVFLSVFVVFFGHSGFHVGALYLFLLSDKQSLSCTDVVFSDSEFFVYLLLGLQVALMRRINTGRIVTLNKPFWVLSVWLSIIFSFLSNNLVNR